MKPEGTRDASRPSVGSSEPFSQPSRETIRLDEIVVDTAIQSRAGLNRKTVEDYTERLKAGDEFPALNAFRVDGKLLLADGFHTYQAGVDAGLHEIPVVIHEGSRKDAIKFSLQANTKHGLPRSNDDKRRAARLALEEFPELSDGALAELIKVSQPFVSSFRRELKTVLGSETRLGRDGKKRKSPKPKAPREKNSPEAGERTPKATEVPGAAADDCDTRSDGTPALAFDETKAWECIEDYLRQQLDTWPKTIWKEFGDKLRKFADDECC